MAKGSIQNLRISIVVDKKDSVLYQHLRNMNKYYRAEYVRDCIRRAIEGSGKERADRSGVQNRSNASGFSIDANRVEENDEKIMVLD